MSYVPGFKSRILAGDLHLSAYARDISFPWSQDMLDSTVFTTDGSKTFIPGAEGSTVSVEGLYDVTAFSDLTGWKAAAAQAVTIAPSGLALGSELWMVNALETEFATSSPVGDIAAFSLAAVTDGISDYGVSLADLAAVSADADGTSSDAGASTANGGVGHLHVTAYSGLTNIVVKVQHSANNSVWADLLTFTTASGTTSERAVVAAGTTVNRYLRASFDVTGTGSATCQVGFARR